MSLVEESYVLREDVLADCLMKFASTAAIEFTLSTYLVDERYFHLTMPMRDMVIYCRCVDTVLGKKFYQCNCHEFIPSMTLKS